MPRGGIRTHRFSLPDVQRMLASSERWRVLLLAVDYEIDDVARRQLSVHLEELAQLARQLGGFAPKEKTL